MASDSVTVALDGEPTLEDLSSALQNLRDLLRGLSQQVADSLFVAWVVEGLEVGSAIATFHGKSEDREAVHRIADAYLAVGEGLRTGQMPYELPEIVVPAARLASLLNGTVPSMRFETADNDVTITGQADRPLALLPRPGAAAFGAVEGRVQTLSNRAGLRFTLYDMLNDKAVSCYLRPDQEDAMRDAWGRTVVVEGWVKRDPLSGRPLAIRDVSAVVVRPEYPVDGWRRAWGALADATEPAEVTIRRLRDA